MDNNTHKPITKANPTTKHSNFAFLVKKHPVFYQLASNAERYFSSDPNTALIKVRQLGEALAQDIATKTGVVFNSKTTQADLLYLLKRDNYVDVAIIDAFHLIRKSGNEATHRFTTSHRDAIDALKMARSVCVWYYQSFTQPAFKPAKFVTPKDPSLHLNTLQQQINQLQAKLHSANEQAEARKQLDALEAEKKQEYEQLLEMMDEESQQLSQQNKEKDAEIAQLRAEFDTQIETLQLQLLEAETNNTHPPERPRLQVFNPSEEETRLLIDEQLRQAGWEADSERMDYRKGERPEKGKNKAIAEWSTDRADYVLFIGLTPVATVEAKKQNKNVSGKIAQAERYARQLVIKDDLLPANQLENISSSEIGWQSGDTRYVTPFVFSCNGRPYFKQLAEQSGVWFRDVRKPSNLKKPLQDFYSPQGLIDLLQRDVTKAEQLLKHEPFGYLGLRDYQQKAIQAVEHSLENGQRECLLAMATGTGKTRTIIGLMYRFLKAERFKRILFLVDRTALGEQALDSMQEAKLEQNHTLSSIYNIATLGDMQAEVETRVQVATVQSMVKRIFHVDDTQNSIPPVDQYDCIIIDEAHRGYTLDQEMTDGEMLFRDGKQYLSSYRRVLDYFDAVKIGLTATPALHTAEIFKAPVYIYSYREAVADDWLIDYEPPITMETKLSQQGIHIEKGELVSVIDTTTGDINTVTMSDELNFELSSFNRTVITESFNRVICDELAQNLDPFGDEKTMVFCATELHAEMVERLLGQAFKDLYGDEYNEAAVKKLTGESDKVSQLIRQYKNERYPNIAVTVDLLTTGIDVPKICNLVFLRRVRSRILFEQMIGRATRRCDAIGKTYFRVYDPVKLFETLEDVNTMKPLVKKPNVSIKQLVDELITQVPEAHLVNHNHESQTDNVALDKQALNTTDIDDELSQSNATETNRTHNQHAIDRHAIQQHQQDILDQLSQKLMKVLRKAKKKSEDNPALAEKLTELEESWSIAPENLHHKLKEDGVEQAIEFLLTHNNLLNQLEEIKIIAGSDTMPVIFEGDDELIAVKQNIDDFERPEDYLESFDNFIKQQLNESVALKVVATKPKDMTRETLKEVRLLLDNNGYSKAKLQTAWRSKTNQDITASIVGHIRRAAIGEALIPYETRVNKAMYKIYASQAWKPVQKKWLERIAKQLKHEVIIDRAFINNSFKEQGGAKQVETILGNQLDRVIEQLNEYLWVA